MSMASTESNVGRKRKSLLHHVFGKSDSNKVEPIPPHADSEPGSAHATRGSASVPPQAARQWLYDTDTPMSKYSVDRGLTDESIADWWKRCSGLHTVEDWVTNYRKHPAGWAALLTIHGIPEVTGRLRHKVENYAIYSALFLSFSIPTAMDMPPAITECDVDEWSCVLHKRLFMYLLMVAIATHMLCILLAMSFVNALNEAARDSDVFRLFGRGQGFLATVKTQNAFRYGCVANFAALSVMGNVYIGWDVFVVWALLIGSCFYVFTTTSSKLFNNSSIVDYWREECGGKPDGDDPFDLRIVMELFKARAAQGVKVNEAVVFDANSMQAESRATTPHRDSLSTHCLPSEENLGQRQKAEAFADTNADQNRPVDGEFNTNYLLKFHFLMVLLQKPSLQAFFEVVHDEKNAAQ